MRQRGTETALNSRTYRQTDKQADESVAARSLELVLNATFRTLNQSEN